MEDEFLLKILPFQHGCMEGGQKNIADFFSFTIKSLNFADNFHTSWRRGDKNATISNISPISAPLRGNCAKKTFIKFFYHAYTLQFYIHIIFLNGQS